MAIMANKRSVMTLYSEPLGIYCHQVRIVLAEKGINYEIVNMNLEEHPETLLQLNPYGTVPTLVDRDLIIYEAGIIMEYLDERFPHPPLMPVYPVARAECRQMMQRIEKDLYSLYHKIARNGEDADSARKQLTDSLAAIAPVFADKPYFLSDEFTLVDCVLAPLFWRIPHLGIELPEASTKMINKYCKLVFERKLFQSSLSEAEKELRE